MIYRILKAPPGYPSHQQYMVGVYKAVDLDSFLFNISKKNGSKFMFTLEEARQLLPSNAKRLPAMPEDQFLELWEA